MKLKKISLKRILPLKDYNYEILKEVIGESDKEVLDNGIFCIFYTDNIDDEEAREIY